jgi:hypothetical protein
MSENDRSQISLATLLLLVIFGAPFLLYLPLLLALIDSVTFRTGYVEQAAQWLGVHDFLAVIYRHTLELFGW